MPFNLIASFSKPTLEASYPMVAFFRDKSPAVTFNPPAPVTASVLLTVAAPFKVVAPVAVRVEPKVAAPDALRADSVDGPDTLRVLLMLALFSVDAPVNARVPLTVSAEVTVRLAIVAVVVTAKELRLEGPVLTRLEAWMVPLEVTAASVVVPFTTKLPPTVMSPDPVLKPPMALKDAVTVVGVSSHIVFATVSVRCTPSGLQLTFK